jgi:mannose-6-phosphate isomerase-like protein (cupin superfamily)
MDAVSDVLRAVRLTGAIYLNAEFTAPWCVLAMPDAALRASFLPQSERVVSFHLVTEGRCSAQLTDDDASIIHLDAGELLVVPQGESHIMGSTLDLVPVEASPLLAPCCRRRRAN